MTSPFLGEIRAFSFNYAPQGWQQCNGQTLSIQQNTALFSLLGTMYGGNGVSTFQLPDLRGRIALHVSTSTTQGQNQGTESVTLTIQQVPPHTHTVNVTTNPATTAANTPGPTVILGSGSSTQTGTPVALSIYNNATTGGVALAPLGSTGGNTPHENRMPSLVMNYCIALTGIFPSRN
jgi:microcystin-dependent protein